MLKKHKTYANRNKIHKMFTLWEIVFLWQIMAQLPNASF